LNCSEEEWFIRYACGKVIEADRADQDKKIKQNNK
jgi:hypothetical protein